MEPRVIVFDWDDTICPSSYVDKIRADRYKDLSVHVREYGRVIDGALDSHSSGQCVRTARAPLRLE